MNQEQKDKDIAYEMTRLLQENRSLRNKVFDLEMTNEELKDQVRWVESKIEKMKTARIRAKAINASEDIDTNIKKGDRIVITKASEHASLCVGYVLEVSKEPYNNPSGYFTIPFNHVRMDGGKGSASVITSKDKCWKKVPSDTPLTISESIWSIGVDRKQFDIVKEDTSMCPHGYKNLMALNNNTEPTDSKSADPETRVG